VPDHTVLRRHIGREVDISRFDGAQVHGRLVNVTRRSCWLLAGDEDCFVPLATIAHWQAA
jgi:hypothetical protein